MNILLWGFTVCLLLAVGWGIYRMTLAGSAGPVRPHLHSKALRCPRCEALVHEDKFGQCPKCGGYLGFWKGFFR